MTEAINFKPSGEGCEWDELQTLIRKTSPSQRKNQERPDAADEETRDQIRLMLNTVKL